jgi:TonB family protein
MLSSSSHRRAGRRSARGRSRVRALVALVLAAALHAATIAIVVESGWSPLEGDRSDALAGALERPLQIDSLVEDDGRPGAEHRERDVESLLEALRRPEEPTRAEEKSEEEKRKEEESKDAKGQVVEIPRPVIEERPDKSRFVAEYDSKVAHETHGRPGRGEPEAAPVMAPVVKQPRPSHTAAPSGNPEARPGAPGPLAMREPLEERRPVLRGEGGTPAEPGDDGTMRRPGAPGERDARASRPTVMPGEGGVPGRQGVPNLEPSEEVLERAISHGAGSLDYLKDIDEGEGTALNAKKWKFASFFNRVKRAVSDEWHPDVVYLRHDPSGNVYGSKDRVTILRVHLKPDGKLETVTMLQSSGVDFLDEEATDAFRRAQPFPNPPPQLVDGDGLIHFNFGFVFELSGHTSFKFFKYQ